MAQIAKKNQPARSTTPSVDVNMISPRTGKVVSVRMDVEDAYLNFFLHGFSNMFDIDRYEKEYGVRKIYR